MPKLLWANAYCLLDTSSGASMAVRTMLQCLQDRGWEVEVVGATIFDSPTGRTRLASVWEKVEDKSTKILNVQDGNLRHQLVKTASTVRSQMTAEEEGIWFSLYRKNLEEFQPDIVYYYGGQPLDLLVPIEAKKRGIPSVAYLANGNYSGTKWCEDVDLVLTDSEATATYYREKDGIEVKPIGPFINPGPVLAEHREPKNLLLVNPSLAKGAGIVAQLALMMETSRPDIHFEVVESRGNWQQIVELVSRVTGSERSELSNVTVTPNTDDMRPIYGRARLLLAPSLCWESFGRVAAEAMMNGIPAIVTNRGGLPEVIGNAGLKVNFPAACYEKPYTEIPSERHLADLISRIEQFFGDEDMYAEYVQRALAQGQRHRIEASTQRLTEALKHLIEASAGRDHARTSNKDPS